MSAEVVTARTAHRIANTLLTNPTNTRSRKLHTKNAYTARWFGNLSQGDMDIAINKAFSDFDLDGSSRIDRCTCTCVFVNSHLRPWKHEYDMRPHTWALRNEFQKAMHTLGLCLNGEQYDALFQVC